jgi:3-phenylpropionate/trans-cinnamate dioxygenase ferredoxin reductase subunit
MPKQCERVIVVGAGHGGTAVAAALRQEGFAGSVVLIEGDTVVPYERPPMSKTLHKGDVENPILPASFYEEQEIELRTGTRVESIDRQAHTVELSTGQALPFDMLVLATGAIARELPIAGRELERVYELRTVHDAQALQAALHPGVRLVIIGGGWIGLEVAASARSAGVDVTVIEREERLLARVSGRELSAHLAERHQAQGTRIVLDGQVSAIESDGSGAVAGVVLNDGTRIDCDCVLVGVGTVPNDRIAREAGLVCDRGVVVDERTLTSDPAICAIGDVTHRPLHGYTERVRLESIPSANEQARQAVATILGSETHAPEVPWFWSDQFDLKIQIAGLLIDAETTVVRPAAGNGTGFAAFHTKGRRVVAIETVNASAEFMVGRQLIHHATDTDIALLGDPTVPLSALSAMVPNQNKSAANVASPAPALNLPGPSGVPGRPRAVYVGHDGQVHAVEVSTGESLMRASLRNNLPGIIAECGGMCSCGTCHVYVAEDWLPQLEEMEPEEEDLLEYLESRQDNSRLSCQIEMTDELDGIVVTVPDFETI